MTPDRHRKHAKIPRPATGDWARNELALVGTSCAVIQSAASAITERLAGKWSIAFADASHGGDAAATFGMTYLDGGPQQKMICASPMSVPERRAFFVGQDLVLVNGNHFTAGAQIVFIDDAKPLTQKLDRLTHVVLFVVKHPATAIPDYLQAAIPGWSQIPVIAATDSDALAAFIDAYLGSRVPRVKGLVLAGGESRRMGTDKGLLQYYGEAQRAHIYRVLEPLCSAVFLSCNAAQYTAVAESELAALEDRFTGLGPMGGILTAFQSDPDSAWLAVACDLPYLNRQTLDYLLSRRNPSKYATAFYNEAQGFPEPMVTLWEPRSYPMLLQLLAAGISCPRKALINWPIELVQLPDQDALQNINEPQGYQETLQKLHHA